MNDYSYFDFLKKTLSLYAFLTTLFVEGIVFADFLFRKKWASYVYSRTFILAVSIIIIVQLHVTFLRIIVLWQHKHRKEKFILLLYIPGTLASLLIAIGKYLLAGILIWEIIGIVAIAGAMNFLIGLYVYSKKGYLNPN